MNHLKTFEMWTPYEKTDLYNPISNTEYYSYFPDKIQSFSRSEKEYLLNFLDEYIESAIFGPFGNLGDTGRNPNRDRMKVEESVHDSLELCTDL